MKIVINIYKRMMSSIYVSNGTLFVSNSTYECYPLKQVHVYHDIYSGLL